MFTLTIENTQSNKITLTQNESVYQVVNIDGLEPPKASIFSNEIANMDGAKFNSSKMDVRNIVITIKINGDVETNRQNLYTFFRSGKWCRIFFKNENREVYCEGYAETINVALFTNNEQMQISLLCPDPYFKSLQMIYNDISKVFAAFEFPFAISEEGKEFSIIDEFREAEVLNQSEIEGGMIITITAERDDIPNPVIYDSDTGQYIRLNLTLNEGYTVIINTNKGSKSVKLIVDGVVENAINSFGSHSTWLQMKLGMNHFSYSADKNSEYIKIIFERHILYEGV